MPKAASTITPPSNVSQEKCVRTLLDAAAPRILASANSARSISQVQQVIPYSWLLDPHHAANGGIPRWRFTIGEKPPGSARKIENFS